MDNEAAIAYEKVAIKNISLGQKELKTSYILKYLENEMTILMDLYTEDQIKEKSRNLL